MPRIARIKVTGEPTVYHVISRTALDGFVMGNVEKDFLLDQIKRLSRQYFSETIGFCIMGNHFHLLTRMRPGGDFTAKGIAARHRGFLKAEGKDHTSEMTEDQVSHFRDKWEDLSEYIRDIKQRFSRFYNKRHHRRGFFWAERFKSVVVENGDALINCLAYIDLNPVRAEIVERAEQYPWSSIGYHVQRNNEDDLLSLDFGLEELGKRTAKTRLKYYRAHLYEKGYVSDIENEAAGDSIGDEFDRFRHRTRYFSDSGIIGSKEYVDSVYQQFKHHFLTKKEKKPKTIKGLEGVYSLKRLSEDL